MKRRILLGIAVLAGIGVLGAPARAFEDYARIRAAYTETEGALLDRNGEVLHEARVEKRLRRLGWVSLASVSQSLRTAVVLSEDKRFWDHGGVDWRAMVSAARQNLSFWNKSQHKGALRGASTISMQVASMLSPASPGRRRPGRRSFSEKISQVFSARDLEKSWSKEQILEAYLNLVSFRGELQGIGAASRALFGKEPHGLDLRESVTLAALIRSPESSEELVGNRACQLGLAIAADFQCEALRAWLRGGALRSRSITPSRALAPHLAARLLRKAQVRTTLDASLQAWVLEVLRRQVLSIQHANAHDAAALVVDNRTGQVLAYVGGVGDLSSARYVDGVQAPRQAGSTLKPFLYGMALDKRYLTAASLIDDSPTDIPVLGGVYRPRNYDNDFHGPVSLRTALGSSLNVPAVRTLSLVGVEAFVGKLRDFGITGLREAEYYGPSLALGSADVTLWDLTNAYRALANGGRWSELKLELSPDSGTGSAGAKGRPSHRVLSPEASYLIAHILSDRESRALTFGLENVLSSRFWTAAKTGTSKDMRDNWCLGFSERYTVGIWVGNFSGEPMWNVSGMTGAAPAWAEIMRWLHRGPGRDEGSRAPRPPRGVRLVQGEWYVEGTEPRAIIAENPLNTATGRRSPLDARIRYPAEGTLIALDPDIPPDHQEVRFESESGAPDGLRWLVNGQPLEPGAGWKPRKAGNYELTLLGPDGARLDQVHFIVRGK